MKLSTILTAAMLGILLPMPNLFARNKTELHVIMAFNIEAQRVPAGDYTLEWNDSNSPETRVKIIKGNKVVVTVPVKWVTLGTKSPSNAVIVSNEDRVLVQIRFAGQSPALEVSQEKSCE